MSQDFEKMQEKEKRGLTIGYREECLERLYEKTGTDNEPGPQDYVDFSDACFEEAYELGRKHEKENTDFLLRAR